LAAEGADAFCDSLRLELLAITDERGRPIVRRVLRTRDWYSGKFLDDLPDLLVDWNEETGSDTWPVRIRACSPRVGVVEGVSQWNRTGEHRPEGMFIAAGPHIRPGALERHVSILDFAPTFMALLGVDWSADGRVIEELLG
jgi:predicted AlkP superfamily phosphohydrolase/phosphomutase